MDEGVVVVPLIGVLELLLLASLSAIAFRRIRFPYTIGLVIVGVVLAVAEKTGRSASLCVPGGSS